MITNPNSKIPKSLEPMDVVDLVYLGFKIWDNLLLSRIYIIIYYSTLRFITLILIY